MPPPREAFGRAAACAAAARLRRRGARPAGVARRGRRRPGVPAPGRRLRGVVPRLHRGLDPREAEDPAADVGGADLRLGAAAREGRPDRRAVRQAALRAGRACRTSDELPSFFGHMVNDDAPSPEARVPDPERMVQAYHQSAATLNLLRAFTKGGFADLTQVHMWNQEFVASAAEGQRYEAIAAEIERAISFMRACGIDLAHARSLHQVDVWTSHEGLAARLRGGLDAPRLAHRRLVRLLGAHALDRRADAAAGRRARGVLRRRPQPARRQGRADGDRRGGASSSASG